jgi:aryl-alcohol dehydrogenase-like predicted oxidoreductase
MIMETRPFAGLSLSRLMLGTVQLGMPYGIANKTGQPDYKEVCAILACAHDGGVNCLDTAAAYGSSEEVLGRALAELGLAAKMTIVTKVEALPASVEPAEAALLIERSVTRSLKRLRVDTLPLCLIHHEEDFRFIDVLLGLKERGLVKRVGASVMTPQVARGIANSGKVEAMQVPSSVLDRRYVSAGVFRDAQQHGLGLFVRSMYLQGLALLPLADIAPELSAVVPVLQRLRDLAAEAGMSLPELCIRYVLALDGVTCGVVGIETLQQMQQNVAIFQRGPLDREMMKRVIGAVPDLPDSILMPNKWPPRPA